MSVVAVARTRRALTDALGDARKGWSPWYTAAAAFVALAALVPAVAPSWVHVDSLADGLYLALAATGLWISVGLAGMPSLGQGAFMAIGAFAVALLTAKAGWPAGYSPLGSHSAPGELLTTFLTLAAKWHHQDRGSDPWLDFCCGGGLK